MKKNNFRNIRINGTFQSLNGIVVDVIDKYQEKICLAELAREVINRMESYGKNKSKGEQLKCK